tara:strand:+ start:61 stop:663 length:603 start_codon:yes stop_codon:yes gene_type:complete
MSVRPTSARLAPASGAPPPRRWPTLDPRRANDSADEMIQSLVKDVRGLQERLYRTEEDVKLLLELRARDHSAREDAFTGRFVAMGGTFKDDEKSVYDVKVGLLDDSLVRQLGRGLADDTRGRNAKWLVTVRFTSPILLGRVNYDGKIVYGSSDFDQLGQYTQDEYEIKCAARRYMLEHTDWQPMFPTGKEPDSVAPYALF